MTEPLKPDPGIKLKLKDIKSLLERFGNPQDKIANVIHIAGTNGKGSTLAFLERLLIEDGFSVGKYTSPHLRDQSERFLLDQEPISEKEFSDWEEVLNSDSLYQNLTFFERLTAIAFLYYASKRPDYFLLETGLGGRLDATNVVRRPTLCLITNIALDHQEYLGETLEEIAFEKAGILKPNTPYFTMEKEPALGIIRRQARAIGAIEVPLRYEIEKDTKLGLAGAHQYQNATLALNAYAYLNESQFEREIFHQALKTLEKPIHWEGRLQEISLPGGQMLLLDGAHNSAGAKTLRAEVDRKFEEKPICWLIGLLASKDHRAILQELLKDRPEDRVIFTMPTSAKLSQDLEILRSSAAKWLKPENIALEPNLEEAFRLFLAENHSSYKVISGSLYLVGNLLKMIGTLS
ncbi:MAG: Mur ligase family protein [Candidatus Caenarcaniphilales bacterium]|nr:Mur ligase family protein [Candidatus Caenarcaniphilales bacterium]